jgi:hypothetical protein
VVIAYCKYFLKMSFMPGFQDIGITPGAVSAQGNCCPPVFDFRPAGSLFIKKSVFSQLLARKLLTHGRNQLIPCSFVLKDFCRCLLVPVFFLRFRLRNTLSFFQRFVIFVLFLKRQGSSNACLTSFVFRLEIGNQSVWPDSSLVNYAGRIEKMAMETTVNMPRGLAAAQKLMTDK